MSVSKSSRITLKDVALVAGVSVQTASQVLAETPSARLSMVTREKVRKAADELGYKPNRLAQAMQKGQTNVVGVWMPIDRPIYPYMQFISAFSESAMSNKKDVMLIGLSSRTAYSGEGRAPNMFPVDGLIAVDAGKAVQHFRSDPQNDATPVIVLGLEEYVNADRVSWDVAGMSRQLTEELIASGAKHIVHLTMGWIISDYPREQRRRGYTEAMTEAGLEPRLIGTLQENRQSAVVAMEEYIEAHGVPDAITCVSDNFAIGAIRVLRERGVDVPNQCQVWGWGNSPEAADAAVPVSSVESPYTELALQAWQWLIERMNDSTIPNRLNLMQMKVYRRSSTR